MRGRNPDHHSDSSCKLEMKVAISFLVSFLKTLLVTVDGWNGVGGTESVHEVGWWSVDRSSVCMAAFKRKHFAKEEGDMKM